MQRRGAMSDFTQIIDEELRVSAEDFPADRDDEMAWHFTDKDIRGLLVRVAERVEETMFDPHAVASVIATIGHERDEWKKKHEQLLGRPTASLTHSGGSWTRPRRNFGSPRGRTCALSWRWTSCARTSRTKQKSSSDTRRHRNDIQGTGARADVPLC
jgi:hypothetical protein